MGFTLRIELSHSSYGPADVVRPLLLVENKGDEMVVAPDLRTDGYFPRLQLRHPDGREQELSPFAPQGGGAPLPDFELYPDCDLVRLAELSRLADISAPGEYELRCIVEYGGTRTVSEPCRWTQEASVETSAVLPATRGLELLTEAGAFYLQHGQALRALYRSGLVQYDDDSPYPFECLDGERIADLSPGARGFCGTADGPTGFGDTPWLVWLDGEQLVFAVPIAGLVTNEHPLGHANGQVVGGVHGTADGGCEVTVLDDKARTLTAVGCAAPTLGPMPDGPITEIHPRDRVQFEPPRARWTMQLANIPTAIVTAAGVGSVADQRAILTLDQTEHGVEIRCGVTSGDTSPPLGPPQRVRGATLLDGGGPSAFIDTDGIVHVALLARREQPEQSAGLTLVHATFDHDSTPLVTDEPLTTDLGPCPATIEAAATTWWVDDEYGDHRLDWVLMLDGTAALVPGHNGPRRIDLQQPPLRPPALLSTRDYLALATLDERGRLDLQGLPR